MREPNGRDASLRLVLTLTTTAAAAARISPANAPEYLFACRSYLILTILVPKNSIMFDPRAWSRKIQEIVSCFLMQRRSRDSPYLVLAPHAHALKFLCSLRALVLTKRELLEFNSKLGVLVTGSTGMCAQEFFLQGVVGPQGPAISAEDHPYSTHAVFAPR